jgi:putative membrane protein
MIDIAKLRAIPTQLTPRQTALLTLWSLIMISLPIVDWTFGWNGRVGAINAGVLAQSLAVIAVLAGSWGWIKTLKTAVLIAFIGWVMEFLGSHTGFPFGAYSYTGALRPQVLDVPLIIPFAWMMMLPPSWAVAWVITRGFAAPWRTPAFSLISALAMTVWDLFLDPQMVAWDLWRWQHPSGYFGIPWSNYAGWLLVSGLITAVVRPNDLPAAPLLLVYTITWLLETFGLGLFWGITGPAVVGGILMGTITILGWRAYWKGS